MQSFTTNGLDQVSKETFFTHLKYQRKCSTAHKYLILSGVSQPCYLLLDKNDTTSLDTKIHAPPRSPQLQSLNL
ncbi:hypothetical protein VIGAN_03243500 [Vigna angularis var. angularis]|uniref:Uncharacterized protein n=1 Tax=Vigna angularis var. angularis TaxID=157739 RepID=A0A0S3RP96_PHAAN|nr:hypothetical protein VIGAN_03243500 [Vigna angularis var. angularis]